MPAAIFGITNDGLNLAVSLLILFLVVLWLALVAWTYLDARRRLEDGFLIVCAAACSLVFPFVGTIIYSILRPPEFLADNRERELEIRAAELRVRQLEEQSCPNCEHPIERNYLRCPSCRARIKDPCESCGKPIDPRWAICPYCEMPARRSGGSERRPEKKRRAKPAARASGRAAAEARAASGAEPAKQRPATSEPPPPPRGRTAAPSAEHASEGGSPGAKPAAARKTAGSGSAQRRTSTRRPKQSE